MDYVEQKYEDAHLYVGLRIGLGWVRGGGMLARCCVLTWIL